ncbi:hypothetical protein CTAYLR_002341 [Chrysophaeum taylorii]|uniref:Uncharacterized protein n=1 Tax=Chrysophaeum taylorii TaxID=2483200 RepID=A0AAD7XN99_9STRA|nr:hypothetical protein CTAYLR_002341 [Chrysophaeum taylorii]
MATFLESPKLLSRYVPGPSMERGHALNLYAHPSEARLIYPFAKFVIVRSLEVPTDNFVYRGHRFAVGVARFSPNGFWVASGDAGGFLRVWSWDNPEHTLKLEVQALGGAIVDLEWDGESKRICVVGDGKGVVAKCVMWDTGNTVGEMVGHIKKAITCAYRQTRPFRIATGSEDFRVVFYKGPPFKIDHSVSEHRNYVNCVRYAPSGDLFASVGSDKKIVLYDGKEGTVALSDLRPTDEKLAHKGSVYSCAFSPDGKLLATASADKTVKLWVVPDGTSTTTTTKCSTLDFGADVGSMQNAVAWPQKGGLVSVSLSGDVNCLTVGSDNALSVSKVLVAPQAPISAAATTVDDDGVFVGCNDGTVFRFGPENWLKLETAIPTKPGGSPARPCHAGKVTALCAAPPSSPYAVVSAGFDDKIRFASKDEYDAELAVDGQPNALAPLDDGVVFSTTRGVGRVDLSGPPPPPKVSLFVATTFDPTAVGAAADAVVVGGKDGSLRVLDPNTLAEKLQLPPHRGEITAISFSPDGAKLAVSDADREIKLYETRAYAVELQSLWRFHTARVTSLAWHPSSKFLASTANDESIFVWSLDNPQNAPVKFEFAHKDGVTALAWRGDHLVSVGNDACACVWTPL